jgi:hypothetical protein
MLAAAEHPDGITGVFRFVVRRTDHQDGFLYVDSERDYRDPRCLVLEVPPLVEQELMRNLGTDSISTLVGKTVRVSGTAKRVTIWIFVNGLKSDKYYYQTHIPIRDLSQLEILP